MTKENVAVLKIKEDINKVNYKPANDVEYIKDEEELE